MQVVDNAKPKWAKEYSDLAERVSFADGDFFDAHTIPTPGEGKTVYVMRSILHDWDDASATRILRSLAAAMKGSQAKLVLIEQARSLILPGNMSHMRHPCHLHWAALARNTARSCLAVWSPCMKLSSLGQSSWLCNPPD